LRHWIRLKRKKYGKEEGSQDSHQKGTENRGKGERKESKISREKGGEEEDIEISS